MFRRLLTSQAIGLLFTLALLPILLVGVLVYMGGLFGAMGAVMQTSRPLWVRLGAPLGASGLGMVMGLATMLPFLVLRLRTVHRLKTALGELGLEGRPMWSNALQFQGHFGPRYAEAYFYRGPTSEFFVEGDIGTRGELVVANALATGLRGEGALPGRDYLAFLEEAFAQQLLQGPADAAVRGLIVDGAASVGVLHIRPDGALVRYRGVGAFDSSAESLRRVFERLATVVDAAEGVEPAHRVQASSAEALREPRWALPAGCSLWPLAFMVAFLGALPLMLLPLAFLG